MDKEINNCILNQIKWHSLGDRLKDIIGSTQEYDKKILKYSVENQLRYRGNLVRFVVNNEYSYYKQLLDYSRDRLMLFPYHLSDFIISAMRITPFQYYLSVIKFIIDQEKSYDTLPNFTAADCLRLLGIGRNQYIEIMNQPRSVYLKYFGLASTRVKEYLPDKPNENVNIEPWWFINAGYITEEDVKRMVLPEEKAIIDKLVTSEGVSNQILAMDVDERYVRSLYLKGLIYLDVPIYDDDMIVVPPLEGFVMNRVTGDYFETLLYKIFISIDQNSPVSELASILDIDIKLVKNAVSMYCRLGFAHKRNLYINPQRYHRSWCLKLDEYQRLGINIIQENHKLPQSNNDISDFMYQLALTENPLNSSLADECPLSPTDLCISLDKISKSSSSFLCHTPSHTSIINSPSISFPTSKKKVVFLYDSNLAAFLMIGNMSPQLKNHAVTMFEVGKLPDESIDSLLYELSKIKQKSLSEDGLEAKRYFNHALLLHKTIEFLKTDKKLVLDLIPELTSEEGGVDATEYKVGLDLIRVESLSNLDANSCRRLLQKNYRFVISSAPLSQDVGLQAVVGLPNLGPGFPLLNSLWLRLFIYQSTGYGPVSLLLARGSRLNCFPQVLTKADYLLITAWNREPICIPTASALLTINEIASNLPVLIQAYPVELDVSNLFGEEKVYIPFPFTGQNEGEDLCIPSSSHLEKLPAVVKLSQVINLNHICGYITLLKSKNMLEKSLEKQDQGKVQSSFECGLDNAANNSTVNDHTNSELTDSILLSSLNEYQLFDCTFGIPLFDETLNEKILKIISSQSLCTKQSLNHLTKATEELKDKFKIFLAEFGEDKLKKDLLNRGSDDQLHLFKFPKEDQFMLSIERPIQNLIFANGKLSVYGAENKCEN